MSCAESRDLLSAHVDGALAPDERAALEAHLAGCAECRRELAALERTVALVRAIEPARAPAGFVDRVVTAARPTPWSTRLARRLFVPWPKIPLEAAALLLVAGLAVMLFRGSVDQQRLARHESAPPAAEAPATTQEPARQVAPPAEAPRPMTERPTPAPSALDGARPRSDTGAKVQAPASERARAPVEEEKRAEPTKDSSSEAAVGELRRDGAESQTRERAAESDRVARSAAQRPAAPAAPPPAGAAGTATPLSRTGPGTGIPAPPPDVTARLRTADVTGAERALSELAARVGGRRTGRRIDGGLVVVELAVPGDAYAGFLREAAGLGALSVERQATERPVLNVAITVSN
jgi:hypothetical protein